LAAHAGADQGAVHVLGAADADAAVVEGGAAAAGGTVQILGIGGVDHAVFQLALDLDADRHGVVGQTMQEVGGAVERIDDPQHFVVAVLSAFLAQHGVLRIGLADDFDDFAFRAAVHLGDEIVAALALDQQLVDAISVAHDEVAGGTRGGNSDVDERMHGQQFPVCLRTAPSPENPGLETTGRKAETPAPSADF